MKYFTILPLLFMLMPSASAYTLVPDGNGGYDYGTGPTQTTINTIDLGTHTNTTIYRDNLPVQTCTTFSTAPGYSTTNCY